MAIRECRGCHASVETTLKCPKCVQLGLSDSHFCSQECFKQNWKDHHQTVHKRPPTSAITTGHESMKSGYNPDDLRTWINDFRLQPFILASYRFTGTLRPWPCTLPRTVPNHIPKPDYATTGESREEERARDKPIHVHTDEEIARHRRCCLLARKALDFAHTLCVQGTTGEEIDEKVHDFIVSNGGYPSPLNYYGFPKSCCISVNEVVCHGIPDLRPLEKGDIVNVDITVYMDGMHGDLNESYLVGECDEESKRLVKTCYDALHAAIAICKPGEMYRAVGGVIEDIVNRAGFSVVRTYVGHGVGRLFHTNPNVPHYKANKAKGLMKPGHVFTIEPMINAGKHQNEIWPDQWTAVTSDGRRSAQFEHQILITDDGELMLPDSSK